MFWVISVVNLCTKTDKMPINRSTKIESTEKVEGCCLTLCCHVIKKLRDYLIMICKKKTV